MEYLIKKQTLKEIADAVRNTIGSTEAVTIEKMISLIENVNSYHKGLLEGKVLSVYIPDGTESLRNYCFIDCGISGVNMSDTVTTIGISAFRNTLLESVLFSKNIKRIKAEAFANCQGLTTLSFPNSLISLERYVFSGCLGLREVVFNGMVKEISAVSFHGCTNIESITVPWAEGEVAGAPWGATNATIVYNYVPQEEM